MTNCGAHFLRLGIFSLQSWRGPNERLQVKLRRRFHTHFQVELFQLLRIFAVDFAYLGDGDRSFDITGDNLDDPPTFASILKLIHRRLTIAEGTQRDAHILRKNLEVDILKVNCVAIFIL